MVTITGTNLTGTSSVTFGGTAATTVTVASPTSVTCVTPAKPAGAVTVVLTTASGTATMPNAYTYVTNATAPIITSQPASVTVNPNQTATFTVVATGTPAPTYQWQRNGANINGATAASYTTPVLTAADHGATFRCQVTNIAGSVTSVAANLSVNAAPAITSQPSSQIRDVG